MGYQHIQVPQTGEKITVNSDFSLNVPNNPVIPFIEGDGIGVDITPVMVKVINAAVSKAYSGDKQISWMEVFCGEKAAELYEGDWFPAETLQAVQDYIVSELQKISEKHLYKIVLEYFQEVSGNVQELSVT